MPQDIIITGVDGVRRRARKGEIIQEGEQIHFPATLMDAMQSVMADATASNPMVRDGYGATAGHRPGYAFAGNNASLRDAATQAYEERCARLAEAWRHRDQPHGEKAELVADGEIPHQPLRTDASSRTPDDTQLGTDAERAWVNKKLRLEQAWRRHRA